MQRELDNDGEELKMPTTSTTATPATARARETRKQPKTLPAPNSDFYQLVELLPAEDKATVQAVRAFMESKVAPIINKYWVEGAFPFELLPAAGMRVDQLAQIPLAYPTYAGILVNAAVSAAHQLDLTLGWHAHQSDGSSR